MSLPGRVAAGLGLLAALLLIRAYRLTEALQKSDGLSKLYVARQEKIDRIDHLLREVAPNVEFMGRKDVVTQIHGCSHTQVWEKKVQQYLFREFDMETSNAFVGAEGQSHRNDSTRPETATVQRKVRAQMILLRRITHDLEDKPPSGLYRVGHWGLYSQGLKLVSDRDGALGSPGSPNRRRNFRGLR